MFFPEMKTERPNILGFKKVATVFYVLKGSIDLNGEIWKNKKQLNAKFDVLF